MKILCISDNEINELYEGWTDEEAEKLRDIGLILSAGDLNRDYLEFLETMLNVPLLYVRGNHDTCYDDEPPEGCLGIDDKVVEIMIDEDGMGEICENIVQEIPGTKIGIAEKEALRGSGRLIRVAGLGGSMRLDTDAGEMYAPEDEFTESEMSARVRKLKWMLKDYSLVDKVLSRNRQKRSSQLEQQESGSPELQGDKSRVIQSAGSPLDILLTHSPSFGYGDLPDLAHNGYKCFNEILMEMKPKYHVYGHVHQEYGVTGRESTHPSGTCEVNVCGMYILDM